MSVDKYVQCISDLVSKLQVKSMQNFAELIVFEKMVTNKRKIKSELVRSSKRSRLANFPRLRQETKKPTGCSILKWRRIQVKRYLKSNPEAKGREVKIWIQQQTPDPQPEANARKLDLMIERFNVQQDTKRPEDCPLANWRRRQVSIYIKNNPEAKGKAVKRWLQNYDINPWPEETTKRLTTLITKLRNTAEKGVLAL